VTSIGLPSPPITRTRSRKLSNEVPSQSVTAGPSSSRSKGKTKQVEFSDKVEVQALPEDHDQDSDLTDLAELEESISLGVPSPRRLRSKGERPKAVSRPSTESVVVEADGSRRMIPMRKAKRNIGSLKESDDEQEEDELIESDIDDRVVDDEDTVSSTSRTSMVRRTPLRRRLRPRRTHQEEPPSDGDDEDSDGEGAETVESVLDAEDENAEEDIEEDDDVTIRDESDAEEDDDFVSEPRVLRNGKVVGDEDAESDEEEEVVERDDEESVDDEEEEESQVQDDISIDLEADDSEEDAEAEDAVEDDSTFTPLHHHGYWTQFCIVDLTVATNKTLIRLRRDDLVRLCESRDLEVSGTKPQLIDALLQWRDQHLDTFSSPSSVGTARPPSTARPRRRKTRSGDTEEVPVLLRSHVHMDEPRTPPLSERNKGMEPELELDLESLGLDDREIPPEKITKLEKIGSGGFKDVFIGKFKNRRVAIAEFRGQLNASK
jgi:mitogen-activated protein kinase kinase kinase 13